MSKQRIDNVQYTHEHGNSITHSSWQYNPVPDMVTITYNGVEAEASHAGIHCNKCDEVHGFITGKTISDMNIWQKTVAQYMLIERWRRGQYCDCVSDQQ